jgi:dienelactone hydrolase
VSFPLAVKIFARAIGALTLLSLSYQACATQLLHERAAALQDYVQLQVPPGAGPHPLAILMPGCLGWHAHHEAWREQLLSRGYAVLHVDSFAANGLDSLKTLQREVCSGVLVRGEERAGDLMAVLENVIARTDIRASNSVIFGWSHGGWSALEFLMRRAGALRPSNLQEMPTLDSLQIGGAVLFYPYCGPGSLSGTEGYPAATRTLLFHGSRDVITNPKQCRARATALARDGADIEFISMRNASHWFDNFAEQQTYDASATARARARIDEMLATFGD